ncbi:MAG: CoA synthetase [Proteobacteria bacterium]|nr:CoA synthetase [Pseudomonadota bacterium]
MTDASNPAFLIATLARLIEGARHIAVGAQSPIPGSAALLVRRRSSGATRVTVLGSRAHNSFTEGGRELFDCAAQGRIDVFFLGGGQIDGEANINLVGTGGYPRSAVRFPGSFGSAYLYFLVPRVILFREEHSRRLFVPKVEFISAPGWSPPEVYRPGGPVALLTGLCLFRYQRAAHRFALESVHPGHTLEEVRDHTGFDFDLPASVATTPTPDTETLGLIAEVGREIAEIYPQFAARLAAAA